MITKGNSTYSDFSNMVQGKKCVIFGCGHVADAVLDVLKDEISFSYAVDNDFWKWGKKFDEYEICSPRQLLEENPDELVVLIATMYFEDVAKQLDELNVKHYFAFPLFFDKILENYNRFTINFKY